MNDITDLEHESRDEDEENSPPETNRGLKRKRNSPIGGTPKRPTKSLILTPTTVDAASQSDMLDDTTEFDVSTNFNLSAPADVYSEDHSYYSRCHTPGLNKSREIVGRLEYKKGSYTCLFGRTTPTQLSKEQWKIRKHSTPLVPSRNIPKARRRQGPKTPKMSSELTVLREEAEEADIYEFGDTEDSILPAGGDFNKYIKQRGTPTVRETIYKGKLPYWNKNSQ